MTVADAFKLAAGIGITTNRVALGANGYWHCCCGHMMMFLEAPARGPRLMTCTNPACEHQEVLYREPTFQIRSEGKL